VVRVEALASQGHEQLAAGEAACVGGHAGERQSGGRGHAQRRRDLIARPGSLGPRPPDRLTAHHSAPSSRTIARSSNGCFTAPTIWEVSCPLPASRILWPGRASSTASAITTRG